MRDVFHGRKGTARGTGYGSLVKMGGKSGTSQVVSIAEDAEYDAEELEEAHRDHSLFIAFAPYDDPAIAVAVIVENGGNGSAVAAPIARRVIEQFLKGPGRFAAQQTQSPGSGLGNEGRSEDGLSSGLQGGNRQGRGSG